MKAKDKETSTKDVEAKEKNKRTSVDEMIANEQKKAKDGAATITVRPA